MNQDPIPKYALLNFINSKSEFLEEPLELLQVFGLAKLSMWTVGVTVYGTYSGGANIIVICQNFKDTGIETNICQAV